ncbi:MAG: hypothetical protein LUC19_05185 [Oscillospiraceae bacterium]|nr:hypothetical protein [Oscillospiraceae bacterium]
MPGGMGGGMGGGLMSLLRRGGGMGGGMGMGGMGRNQNVQQTQQTDEYDVDRWQRADGLDAAAPTMVQTVRADWDGRAAAKQQRSPVRRLINKLTRKKDEPAAAPQPDMRPVGGTVTTPEMKKATQRTRAAEAESAVQPEPAAPQLDYASPNYLGLSFHTELDGFMTANPINSAILAGDSLSMGMLTLNQATPVYAAETPRVQSAPAPENAPLAVSADGAQNIIAQRAELNYMNDFHRSREEQKYNVRIT